MWLSNDLFFILNLNGTREDFSFQMGQILSISGLGLFYNEVLLDTVISNSLIIHEQISEWTHPNSSHDWGWIPQGNTLKIIYHHQPRPWRFDVLTGCVTHARESRCVAHYGTRKLRSEFSLSSHACPPARASRNIKANHRRPNLTLCYY